MADTPAEIFASLGIDPNQDAAHYGRLGQRWGKRIFSGGGSSGGSSAPPKRTVKDMSDDELRTAITRMKLEKEFVQLATPPPSAAKKAAKQMIAGIAKQQSEAFIKQGMSQGGSMIRTAVQGSGKHRK